jgi:hypothetical protein
MEGPLKVTGDFSIVALVGAGSGLVILLVSQFLGQRGPRTLLHISLGAFFFGWVALLASWWSFITARGKQATCIVQAETGEGAVWAHGAFREIFHTGAYAFGTVLGSWLLLPVTMLLILQRIKAKDASEVPAPAKAQEESEPNSEAMLAHC